MLITRFIGKSMKKKVDILTRVEGEGRIIINEENGIIKDVILNIFEPPRFIEGILRGRSFECIPDITARICGICPVAYQMSGVQAVEDAFDIHISPEIENLRKLFYYGEWIQSHAIHVFLLHLPDFFNKSSIFEIAKENPEIFKNAMKIKEIGGKIIEIIGGRVSHPVSVKVGGFTKYPDEEELKSLITDIENALDLSISFAKEFSKFNFPEDDLEDIHFVSLYKEDEYAILNGKIISNKGIKIDKSMFENIFKEFQVPTSTAKKSRIFGEDIYLVGPISRFNNNFEKLSPLALKVCREINLYPPVKNTFKSIIVRIIEIIHSLENSIKLINDYKKINDYIAFKTKLSEGTGVSEAPRGILWHKYKFDENGTILEANIIPPTSQNQDIMEKVVLNSLNKIKSDNLLELSEKIIRNFDPCISCATHILKVDRLSNR